MKKNKILSLLLAAALPLSLAACGNAAQSNPETAAADRSAPAAASAETPAETPAETSSPAPAAEAGTASPLRAEPHFAADYAEILASLRSTRYMTDTDSGSPEPQSGGAVMDAAASMEAPAAAEGMGGGLDGEREYSGTNVQVEGVDEGDIVKTDGEYIYVLNGEYTLTVIRAEGTESRVVSQSVVGMSESKEWDGGYSYAGKSPREMFVSGGALAIISNYYGYSNDYGDDDVWIWNSDEHCCVDFYDVSNPASPRMTASLGQDGMAEASRLLDGRLYLVSSKWVWDYDENEPGTYVPCLYENGEPKVMPATDVAICGTDSTEYVIVCCYDLASGALSASQSLLGSGSNVYMNGENLYVLGSRWEENELRSYTESVYSVKEYRSGGMTDIYRFDLSDGLTLAASGSVPGYMDSQFSADEYQGHLRIVATRDESVYRVFTDETYGFSNYQWDESSSSTGLFILDENLDLTGSVTDLAEGERVYSARFDGPIAYFSTFRTVDPLFAADCSDPTGPVVLSALKISGFSEYLHPWADSRLFGFGREADEESGRADGLKLVMFDTSDKTDVTVKHTLNLDATYSEALYDHKAFFISPEKNIIGFLGDDDYYIFSYDDEAGFTELSHFWFDVGAYRVRGLYIGSDAYIVSSDEMMVLDMNTWGAPEGINISAAVG